MRMLALCCGSLLSLGCSFIFVRPPPSQPEPLAYFDCVSNGAAPATDVTNAVVDGLLLASALETGERGVATGVGVVGAVYAASAIYGFVMTSRCASAKERLAARVNELARERIIQRGELRVERDASLKGPGPALGHSEARGCRRDINCKGERICAYEVCVYPPAAPAPAVQPPPASPAPATIPAPTPAPTPVSP